MAPSASSMKTMGGVAATLYAGHTFVGFGSGSRAGTRGAGIHMRAAESDGLEPRHLRGAGSGAAASEIPRLPAMFAGAGVVASVAAARAARRHRAAASSRSSLVVVRRAGDVLYDSKNAKVKNPVPFDASDASQVKATHELEFKKRPFGVLKYEPSASGKGARVADMVEKSRYPGDPQGQASVAGLQTGWAVKSIGGVDVSGWDFWDIMDLQDDFILDNSAGKFQAGGKGAMKNTPAELPLKVEYAELNPVDAEEAAPMEIPDDGKWRPRMGGWTSEELAAERAKYMAMAPLSDYDGPTYAGPSSINEQWIQDLLNAQENGKRLPLKDLALMVLDIIDLLKTEDTVVERTVNQGQTLQIVGDIHGQYWDFMHLLSLTGHPSPTNPIHFNGDFVDRGSWSIEVISILYAFKLQHPDFVYFNRGNHELLEANIIYGFMGECHAKFGTGELFDLFSESFRHLPLAHLYNKDIMVVHGGLPGPNPRIHLPGQSHDPSDAIPPNVQYPRIDDIKKLDRYTELSAPAYKAAVGESDDPDENERRLLIDLMWSDPRGTGGYGPSFRKSNGIFMFGPDVSKAFCDQNGLSLVVRSHEVKMEGFKYDHPNLLTIFSAANYLDTGGNMGGYATCVPKPDGKLNLEVKTFDAQPHPDTPAMFWQDYVTENLSYLTKKMKKKTGPVYDSNGMLVQMSQAEKEDAANQWEEDDEGDIDGVAAGQTIAEKAAQGTVPV